MPSINANLAFFTTCLHSPTLGLVGVVLKVCQSGQWSVHLFSHRHRQLSDVLQPSCLMFSKNTFFPFEDVPFIMHVFGVSVGFLPSVVLKSAF